MVLRIVIPITGLKIDKLSRSFSFLELHLVKDQNIILSEFSTPGFIEQIGVTPFNRLLNSTVFYATVDCSDDMAKNSIRIAVPAFDTVQLFLTCLWFIKDNSCNTPSCYGFIKETGVFNVLISHQLFTNCIGEYIEEGFTNDELERTANILGKFLEIIGNKQSDIETYKDTMPKPAVDDLHGLHPGLSNRIDYNTKNRIERAFMFMRAARSTTFILMKISLYMNVYECLFTTDATEITHKMSERVAFYYTEDKIKRLEIFKLIKSAYLVRSRYFHGKELDKKSKFETIPNLLANLDNLTREIFTKIIMEDSEIFLRKDLEPWFEELIFS